MTRIDRTIASLVAPLAVATSLVAFAPFARAADESAAKTTVVTQEVQGKASIPIELPVEAAQPSPDEPVGGLFFELFIAFILVAALLTAIFIVAEATHHHVWHECEDCYHHRYAPPPPPPPAPTPGS